MNYFKVKRPAIKSRFLDWFLSVSLKDACEWFFKRYLLWGIIWVVVMTVCFVGVDSLGWDSEDETTIFYLILGLMSLPFVFITYILDCILADRTLQMRNKKIVLMCILNSAYAVPLLNMFVNEDASYYIEVFSTILFFAFYAFIIRYGYPIYRKACWFMLYACVLKTLGDEVSRVAYTILEVAFYVKLYQTAKKCDLLKSQSK